VFTDDYARLAESVVASLKLELLGFAFGASIGFLIGVGLGWSRAFGYWVHPVMRFIGPLPSIAWLPIAFFVFPSSFSASIFLIGLTTGFPVAVLTWSGVASVNSAYYDVARTLGASPRFLILKVAIPAALPHVFVGCSWAGRIVRGARHCGDDGRESRPRLLSAMGAGLGRLREYVCGAGCDGADVLGAYHSSVQSQGPSAVLSERGSEMVAAPTRQDAAQATARPLDFRGVSHAFHLEGHPLPVLEDISFRVEPGSSWAFSAQAAAENRRF